MKVVLDANVVVAAFATRGICSALFEYCVENDEIVLCDEILSEIERALIRKVRVPKTIALEVVAYLVAHAEILEPEPLPSGACRDKSDLPVLGVAKSGACKYIITEDRDLLRIAEWDGIEIISPRMYWHKMRRGKPG
jgi:putative PIN family toxin of toxin-antitoxin system